MNARARYAGRLGVFLTLAIVTTGTARASTIA